MNLSLIFKCVAFVATWAAIVVLSWVAVLLAVAIIIGAVT